MKKIIFSILITLTCLLGYSQQTYVSITATKVVAKTSFSLNNKVVTDIQMDTIFSSNARLTSPLQIKNFVIGRDGTLLAALALKAPITSPTFLISAFAPTPTAGDNTTKIATTSYVVTAIATAPQLTVTSNTITPQAAGLIPNHLGDIFINTATNKFWMASGTTSAATDWIPIN